MSWEIFKQNILRVTDNPESISSTDMIADLYAKEYDAAIKRGFDTTHKVTLKKGNVELMRKMFKLALDAGLTQTGDYDLVGAMGDGVLAYWAGAVMNEIPIPIIPATGATSNIAVTSNVVVSNGVWEKSIGGVGGDFMDDPGDDNAKIEFAAVEEYEIDNGEIAVPEAIEEISEVLDESVTYTELVDNGGNTSGETAEEYISGGGGGVIIDGEIDFVEVIDVPQTEEEKQAAIDAVKNLPPTKIYGKIGASTGPLSPPPGLPKNMVNGTIPANVLASIGNGMLLHKEAAVQYLKLKEQARKDGIRFTISSAYRPLADQWRLYKKYPKGQAATPGSSIHGWGCAIDIGEIANDCKVRGGGIDGRTLPSVNAKVRQTNPLYRWFSIYGPKYGWYNPYRLADNSGNDEAWHWEYWGFFVKHD